MKPQLETPRLSLVPFGTSDMELLHETFTDAYVRKYLWDDQVISRSQTSEILAINEQHFSSHRWGLWKLMSKDENTYLGFAGLWHFFDESQPQLLYGLLPAHAGHGYATEGAQAVINYAFDVLGFDYILAACDSPHTNSRKVCERVGMTMLEERIVNGKETIFYRLAKVKV